MAKGLDLGKQIGPLPLGAWMVVVGAGLGFGFLINKRQESGDEEDAFQETDSGVGVGGGQLIESPPTFIPPEPEEEDTNAAWGIRASNFLKSIGFDPYNAQNAINKFLAGMNLSVVEQDMVNRAILRFGNPPEPIAPVDVTPTPPTPPAAAKPPAVTNLTARSLPKAVGFSWKYTGPPITGFLVKITRLRDKRVKGPFPLPAGARSYTYTARGWSRRTNSEVQIYIRPIKGTVAGDGRTATAKPRI